MAIRCRLKADSRLANAMPTTCIFEEKKIRGEILTKQIQLNKVDEFRPNECYFYSSEEIIPGSREVGLN